MSRIGIYGGSFNPPHAGHVLAAAQSVQRLQLDRLLVIPAYDPPHKQQAYSEWNDRTYRISERIHREILSLPMSPVMRDDEVARVIEVLNGYSL